MPRHKKLMFGKFSCFVKFYLRFLEHNDLSTHESSYRPPVHSPHQGVFSDSRNSLDPEGGDYQVMKRSLDTDVKESPGWKFGNRKGSQNPSGGYGRVFGERRCLGVLRFSNFEN